ncbi:MAG TPA: DUF3108 domain-containing protein [Gammaproteobacteria bacterium]
MKFSIQNTHILYPGLLLFASLLCNAAYAHSSSESHAGHHAHHHHQKPVLNPFSADYALKKKGLTIGKIRLSLTRENDRWRFETHAEAAGLAAMLSKDTITESTLLITGENGIQPVHYRYLRSGDEHGKDLQTEFDWEQAVAKVKDRDETTSVELKDNTLNEHAVTLALILALKSSFSEITYHVLDETKVETQTYSHAGQENVKVPAGEFDAVKLVRKHGSRETVGWYSPTLNYLPVKVQSFKDGKLKSEMELLPVK